MGELGQRAKNGLPFGLLEMKVQLAWWARLQDFNGRIGPKGKKWTPLWDSFPWSKPMSDGLLLLFFNNHQVSYFV